MSPVAWRLHMLAWGAGWDLAPEFRSSPTMTLYVIGLIVVEAATSLATLGPVRPWGEVWPRWLPGLGEQRIPPRFVVVVASLGALAVTVILTIVTKDLILYTMRGISNPILQVSGWHRVFLVAHYLPWPLWPIGLWVAIIGYAKRWSNELRRH